MFVTKFNCSIRFFLMRVWLLFHYRSFFYNKIGSMIPTVVLPTTEIIEAKKLILREHDYFSLFNSLNSLHLVIVLTIKLILDIIVVFN